MFGGFGKALGGMFGGAKKQQPQQPMQQPGGIGPSTPPPVSSSMSPEGQQSGKQIPFNGTPRTGMQGMQVPGMQNNLQSAMQRLQRGRGMYGRIGGGIQNPAGSRFPMAQTGADPREMIHQIQNPENPRLMGGGFGNMLRSIAPGNIPMPKQGDMVNNGWGKMVPRQQMEEFYRGGGMT